MAIFNSRFPKLGKRFDSEVGRLSGFKPMTRGEAMDVDSRKLRKLPKAPTPPKY